VLKRIPKNVIEVNESCCKVDVIIPTFNRGNLLERCVESVLSQNYPNIEILIVDDGSNDDTRNVVAELRKSYPVIRYCLNVRNKGPSGARNTGILQSDGEFVSFLDSDDTWNPGHLASGIQVLNNNQDIDVLFGNFEVMDANTGKSAGRFFDDKEKLAALNHIKKDGVRILHDNLFLALIRENFFHFGSAIVRRSALDGLLLDEDIRYAEDRDFAIQLFKKQKAVFAYRLESAFILYRHGQSLMQSNDIHTNINILQAHVKIYRKYLKHYDLKEHEKSELKNLVSKRLMSLSYGYRVNHMPHKAAACVCLSCRYKITTGTLKELLKVICTFTQGYSSKNKTRQHLEKMN